MGDERIDVGVSGGGRKLSEQLLASLASRIVLYRLEQCRGDRVELQKAHFVVAASVDTQERSLIVGLGGKVGRRDAMYRELVTVCFCKIRLDRDAG